MIYKLDGMKAILEFSEKIRQEKDRIFESIVTDFESKAKPKDWNGTTLKIDNQVDVFFYLSEDKKTLDITWGEFDPKKRFSNLIFFCHYHHVANYINGGLKFIGFYDSNYNKVESIEIGSFKILNCTDGCSFNELKKPTFSFNLEHKYGNKHNSLRGFAKSVSSCQNSLNSIWELNNFYDDWSIRFVHSPNSVPNK
jgi:hypothetical protein